ncbi:MAG: SIP domain-containing protein [Microbacterium sp.]|uniref:SIP domain-containing protein n=1 Tax=Microbacterium sp. TaxID=51671 RepID=UPI001AC9E06C|nr:SIP domain-containing protein [Microbacterium sp.]MBN9178214.1 SIP domain-containing protein [Microbacterium sp.]
MDSSPSRGVPAHFLIAGDAGDLPFLDRLLSRLPSDAYGQVFIEVATAFQITELPAPVGMTVTWLVNNSATRAEPRGELAARAAVAWVAEWMPETQDAHEAPYVMWIGGTTSVVLDRLHDRLGDRLDRLHLHHQHEHGQGH